MECNKKSKELGDGKTNITNIRDGRIDSVKYWLIVLVIAGHVLRGSAFKDNTECIILEKWIYTFHMPLFIFLSGYFSRKKNPKNFTSSIWKLLEPLIIYHIIGLSIESLYSGSITLKAILTPWWILWYLPCLIYWRYMIQYIPDKFLSNTVLVVIISFCISVVAGYFPFYSEFSISKTFSFLPYFFLGYCMRGKNLFFPNKYKPFCLLFLVLSLIIPLFYSHLLDNFELSGLYRNIIMFGLVIAMSVAFINICPNTKWTAKQGLLTMQYFIYHAFILRPLLIAISIFHLPASLSAAIFYTITVTLILGVASYFPYFNELTNPSTIWKKVIK